MERVILDEGASFINYNSLEQGSSEKSLATSPRKSYVVSPALRYGLAHKKSVSVDGACKADDILDQDTAEKKYEILHEEERHISLAKSFEDSSANSSMRQTSETPGESSPRKNYLGSPKMRYRAFSESRSDKAYTDNDVSMIGASKTNDISDQGSEHMKTQSSPEVINQNHLLSSDHTSPEKIRAPTLEKSLQDYFKPGKCPYPYVARVGRQVKESVEEKQVSLEDVRQRSLRTVQEKVQRQELLQKEVATALKRGDLAAVAGFQTLMQKFDADLQSQIIEKVNRNFEYANVMTLLRGFVEEYSKLSFQLELQKLLNDARKIQKNARRSKIVPGRCVLCRSIEDKVLNYSGIPKSSMASVWKMIGNFAHDDEVVRHLSVLDELLSLPLNSNLNVALDCRISVPEKPLQSDPLQSKQLSLRLLPSACCP